MEKLRNQFSFKKSGVSVFLIIVLTLIFFLSYYIYRNLSIESLKQDYRTYFLEIKTAIGSEIEQTIDRGETVNINRIIEPYLQDQIDLLVVYRDDGEIIQAFSKKGITKENLRQIDKYYFTYQEEIQDLLFLENRDTLSNVVNTQAPESPQSSQEGLNDLSLLILTTITPEAEEVPHRYLLIFNSKEYQNQKIILEETIDRNSFYGGLISLGLVGLMFILGEMLGYRKERKFKKEYHKELIRQEAFRVADEGKPSEAFEAPEPTPEETETVSPVDTNITGTIGGEFNEEGITIHDTIEHEQEDVLFNKDDLVEETWIEPESKLEEKEPEKLEKPQESKENFSGENLAKDLFSRIISPFPESHYQEIIDTLKESSLKDFRSFRSFREIVDQMGFSEQKRVASSRLKKLLGIWLFARPISTKDKTPNPEMELTADLIRRSLEMIMSPYFFEPRARAGEYLPPNALLYFRPQIHSKKLSQQPVLTFAYPQHLDDFETPAAIPWLGEEKKLFKKGIPYLEIKPDVVAIVFPSIIDGVPHIVKVLYSPESYKQTLHEQKLDLLYLLEVMFSCLKDFLEFHRNIFGPLTLEKKAEHFFKFVFSRGSSEVSLLACWSPHPTLHLSLWTFDSRTYPQGIEVRFQEMMEVLPDKLHQEFQDRALIFLRDKDRLLAMGYTDTVDDEAIDNGTQPLSERIKLAIEKILLEVGGMEAIRIRWEETPLRLPAGSSEADIKEIFREKQNH